MFLFVSLLFFSFISIAVIVVSFLLVPLLIIFLKRHLEDGCLGFFSTNLKIMPKV